MPIVAAIVAVVVALVDRGLDIFYEAVDDVVDAYYNLNVFAALAAMPASAGSALLGIFVGLVSSTWPFRRVVAFVRHVDHPNAGVATTILGWLLVALGAVAFVVVEVATMICRALSSAPASPPPPSRSHVRRRSRVVSAVALASPSPGPPACYGPAVEAPDGDASAAQAPGDDPPVVVASFGEAPTVEGPDGQATADDDPVGEAPALVPAAVEPPHVEAEPGKLPPLTCLVFDYSLR